MTSSGAEHAEVIIPSNRRLFLFLKLFVLLDVLLSLSHQYTMQFLRRLLTLLLYNIVRLFVLVNGADSDDDDCSLYLAPSSIPNVGLGVYAARDFQLGEWIGSPSIAIPWINHPTTTGTTGTAVDDDGADRALCLG